jgi:hypothetical protein
MPLSSPFVCKFQENAMRSYPRNSPQAAARLVALAMIADGHVCRSEIEAFECADADRRLALVPGELAGILQTLCEDLLAEAQLNGSLAAGLDASVLDALFRELDDPALQRRVMGLIAATAAADGHLADGERLILDAMRQSWGRLPERGPALMPAPMAAPAARA